MTSLSSGTRSNDDYVVDETVASVWNYHIRRKKKDYPGYYKALCGANLLGKELPLSHWGLKSEHIHETYCSKCVELYERRHGIG